MSEETLSKDLIRIVIYIRHVYVSVWFSIKKESLFIQGAKPFYKIISSTYRINDAVTNEITIKVFERNAFFAHIENLLMAKIYNERQAIRNLAWKRIRKARNEKDYDEKVRSVPLPKINVNTSDYIDD